MPVGIAQDLYQEMLRFSARFRLKFFHNWRRITIVKKKEDLSRITEKVLGSGTFDGFGK
jgi:hypothetical protein